MTHLKRMREKCSYFSRLRVFRNLMHVHLMIAILMVVVLRLVLYIDLIFTDQATSHENNSTLSTTNTINTTVRHSSLFFSSR